MTPKHAIEIKWRYAVPLVNERTGERRLVVVELSNDERIEAAQPSFLPPGPPDEDGLWPSLRNYCVTHHALAGMPDEWSVSYSQIERIRLH